MKRVLALLLALLLPFALASCGQSSSPAAQQPEYDEIFEIPAGSMGQWDAYGSAADTRYTDGNQTAVPALPETTRFGAIEVGSENGVVFFAGLSEGSGEIFAALKGETKIALVKVTGGDGSSQAEPSGPAQSSDSQSASAGAADSNAAAGDTAEGMMSPRFTAWHEAFCPCCGYGYATMLINDGQSGPMEVTMAARTGGGFSTLAHAGELGTILMVNGVVYLLDDAQKTALKMDPSQMGQTALPEIPGTQQEVDNYSWATGSEQKLGEMMDYDELINRDSSGNAVDVMRIYSTAGSSYEIRLLSLENSDGSWLDIEILAYGSQIPAQYVDMDIPEGYAVTDMDQMIQGAIPGDLDLSGLLDGVELPDGIDLSGLTGLLG